MAHSNAFGPWAKGIALLNAETREYQTRLKPDSAM
jgi:hypothetical protein